MGLGRSVVLAWRLLLLRRRASAAIQDQQYVQRSDPSRPRQQSVVAGFDRGVLIGSPQPVGAPRPRWDHCDTVRSLGREAAASRYSVRDDESAIRNVPESYPATLPVLERPSPESASMRPPGAGPLHIRGDDQQ